MSDANRPTVPARRVRGRALTAIVMLFTFVVMVVSGVVVYATPRGRAANVLDWQFAGLDKADWGNLHIAFSLLFLIVGLIHIGFNRKPLVNYVRERVAARAGRPATAGVKIELVAAALISLVLLVTAVERIPPVSYLFDLRDAVKDWWEPEGGGPRGRGGGRRGLE